MSADNVHATKGERMYDTGSTTFMLICTMLVFLMTPGLAFFYGGLSRRKNVINTMLMCFGVIGLVGVLWIVAGWSLAYGGDGSNPFIGGFDQLLCLPVLNQVLQAAEGTATDGAVYPQIINIAFQMAFAMITAAIVTGSLAGRVKFGAMTAFLGIWLLVVYAPLAHMVWGGEGSFIGDIIGALDFAGGDVVHISSGLTGLILCLMLGRRRGFGMVSYRPHNVPFVALGAGLLWFGWRVQGRRRGGACHPQHRDGQRGGHGLVACRRARAHRPPHAGGRQHRFGCGSRGGHAGRGLCRAVGGARHGSDRVSRLLFCHQPS